MIRPAHPANTATATMNPDTLAKRQLPNRHSPFSPQITPDLELPPPRRPSADIPAALQCYLPATHAQVSTGTRTSQRKTRNFLYGQGFSITCRNDWYWI